VTRRRKDLVREGIDDLLAHRLAYFFPGVVSVVLVSAAFSLVGYGTGRPRHPPAAKRRVATPFQSHLVLRRGERFLVGRTVERISRQRSMDSAPVDDVAPRLLCLQSPFIH